MAVGAGKFFNENFDAASNWNGDDGTNKAEHVYSDSDRGEDKKGGQFHAATLDFGRDEVGFNLEIDEDVDEEDDAGNGRIESK